MKITVFQGVATLNTDVPVFVGTTGKGAPGATNFPTLGAPLKNFVFSPEKGDKGTLVFDCAEQAQRTTLSPTLLTYWWEGDKLIVREGSPSSSRMFKKFSPLGGYITNEAQWLLSRGTLYVTGHPSSFFGTHVRRVGLIDMLTYVEGKIELYQLDKRSTDK